jgi:FtsK/SpoIIIE family
MLKSISQLFGGKSSDLTHSYQELQVLNPSIAVSTEKLTEWKEAALQAFTQGMQESSIIAQWRAAGILADTAPKIVVQLLLRQIAFAFIASGQDPKDATSKSWGTQGFANFWGRDYVLTEESAAAIIRFTRSEVQPAAQPTQQKTTPTAPAKTSKPGLATRPAPQPQTAIKPHATPIEVSALPRSLHEKGAAIAEAYSLHKMPAHYLPDESCDQGPRLYKLVFAKPVEATFGSYAARQDEALSHAGIHPDMSGIMFERMEGNRFCFYIPRPPEECKIIHLFNYQRALSGVSPHGGAEIVLRSLVNSLHAEADPAKDLEALFAINVRGNPVMVNPCYGVFFGGMTRSGKTSAMCAMTQSLMMRYPTSLLQFAWINLEDKLAFKPFQGTPYTWGSAFDLETCTALLTELRREVELRKSKLELAGAEKIQDYNAKHPKKPLPWIFVTIDELAAMKTVCEGRDLDQWKESIGVSNFDDWANWATSKWYKLGIVVLGATQYPSQTRSIGPDTRLNFLTAIGFRGNENMGELLFSLKSQWSKQITNLGRGGDCIIKTDGYERAQALYVEASARDLLIKILSEERGGLFGGVA